MSKFFAQAKGNRSQVHCQGSEISGIWTSAQSYDGSIIVRLCYIGSELEACIEISDESSANGTEIFRGSLKELEKRLKGGGTR